MFRKPKSFDPDLNNDTMKLVESLYTLRANETCAHPRSDESSIEGELNTALVAEVRECKVLIPNN